MSTKSKPSPDIVCHLNVPLPITLGVVGGGPFIIRGGGGGGDAKIFQLPYSFPPKEGGKNEKGQRLELLIANFCFALTESLGGDLEREEIKKWGI